MEYFFDSLKNLNFEPTGKAIEKFLRECWNSCDKRFVTKKWLEDGKLLSMEDEVFLLHVQTFTCNGTLFKRKSLVLNLNLDPSYRPIYYHERTFKEGIDFHKKALKQTFKYFDPVFLIFKEPIFFDDLLDLQQKDNKPFLSIKDNFGDSHEFYPIQIDKDFLNYLERLDFVVADGHHRVEATKEFGREVGVYLRPVEVISCYDENLIVRPTHRLISKDLIGSLGDLRKKGILLDKLPVKSYESDKIGAMIRSILNEKNSLWVYGEELYLASVEEKIFQNLEIKNFVYFLHTRLISQPIQNLVFYHREYSKILDFCLKNRYFYGIILSSLNPQSIYEISLTPYFLPEKSTDFYPKLIAGPYFVDLFSFF